MDIEELKRLWQEMDRKLDAGLTLNRRAVRALDLATVRTALGRLAWVVAFELAVNLVGVVALGSYAADRVGSGAWRMALPAVALMLGGIALLAVGARQWTALRALDYAAPLVAMQKQVEAIRMGRIRLTAWILLVAPLAWTPLLIVALDALLGIDAYARLGAAYLAANMAFGVAVLVGMRWASRRFAHRMSRSRVLTRIMKDVAGHNLAVAEEFLRTLAAFENDA
ncbi:MAG: hypothetical protein JWN44_3199 [Myxococcales bacterium]|nr:hypothetical protein [Myxococcales bacterium]